MTRTFMPMLNWLNRALRRKDGNASVEFAFMLPVLLLMMTGMLEVGRAYYQANTVEKGLRSGALYAARSVYPLDAPTIATAGNLVKTGTLDGSGPFLVDGWSSAGAGFSITTSSYSGTGPNPVPVIRVEAVVPYVPILPGLMSFTGLGDINMRLSHEQAYIGN